MNKVILHGRLTQDVDIKQNGNLTIGKFSIAVRNDFKNAAGEYETQFFNCTAFNKSADFIAQHFHKGQEILITGRLQNSSWETDSGEKRSKTEIVIETTEFCGTKVNDTTNNIPSEVNVIETNVVDDEQLPF